ncbi:hypothetical protein SKAU_G00257440 [Synaphobranchus kaupii]|uniref:Uncharacterized protein n=1 Tax=Synaphobranchus kaupii TaxID=118154 RepID=A0A9Q1IQE1_SYNKA|nr:hypothetical protein SKAU_G00257440 [Synaphobranchus kaupii]
MMSWETNRRATERAWCVCERVESRRAGCCRGPVWQLGVRKSRVALQLSGNLRRHVFSCLQRKSYTIYQREIQITYFERLLSGRPVAGFSSEDLATKNGSLGRDALLKGRGSHDDGEESPAEAGAAQEAVPGRRSRGKGAKPPPPPNDNFRKLGHVGGKVGRWGNSGLQ